MLVNKVSDVNFNANLKFSKVPKKHETMIQIISQEFASKTKKYPNHTLFVDLENNQVQVQKTKAKEKVPVREGAFSFGDKDGIMSWIYNTSNEWTVLVLKSLIEKVSLEKKLDKLASSYANRLKKRDALELIPMPMVNFNKLGTIDNIIKRADFKQI